MPKRRRERDRPKAGPEAAYNPNKRVLLSYDSDAEEEPEETIPDVPVPPAEAQLTNYAIEEYLSDEEEPEDTELGVDASAEVLNGGDAPKADPKRRDQATNQFPALGVYDEDEMDSDTQEALAYLEAVRTERQGLPEILSARNDAAEDFADDDDEWDPEEAYIGSPAADEPTEDMSDPRLVFTQGLLQRFAEHRRQLHVPASLESLQALQDNQPISFPRGNKEAYTEWHRIVSSQAPKPAQIRSFPSEPVLDVLALIQKHYLVKGKNVKKITSSWIWSLLARLDDVGGMSNDEVYPLRELGKRAVFLQYTISDPQVADQLQRIGEAGGTSSYLDDGEIKLDEPEPEPQKTVGLKEEFVTDNTKATLDMILVIIGEVFRQRDLLDFRRPWLPASQPETAA